MTDTIVNNRIAGTRITVFDIYHYVDAGESPSYIAEALRLTQSQVQAAQDDIDSHREEVLAVHQQIEERIARGNPPEIQALLDRLQGKARAWLKERKRRKKPRSTMTPWSARRGCLTIHLKLERRRRTACVSRHPS